MAEPNPELARPDLAQPAGTGAGAGAGFVLVHGGNHTSQIWERLVPYLDAEARAVDLPGRGSRPADLRSVGLSAWIDAVVEEIDAVQAPKVVLVGHSLAGVILPAIAERRTRKVVHLVLIAAVIPPPGATPRQIMSWPARAWGRFHTRQGVLSPPGELLGRMLFGNDMDRGTAKWLASGQVPEAAGVFDEPVPNRPPPQIPATYVHLKRDRAVPRRMARRQMANYGGPVSVAEIDSGHAVMVTHPTELAAVLHRCADHLSN